MIVGIPKELKTLETRVGMTPAGVHSLAQAGHTVLVEKQAGVASSFTDEEYVKAGAKIVADAAEVWSSSDMVVKVKEPVPEEYKFFRKDLILFTYLHLAPLPELTEKLLTSGVTAIAYETVTDAFGRLPLLVPMSEVAGRLAVQIGAAYLEKGKGGRGLLLGGVPGVPPANVAVLGGGVVGLNAAKIASGMGANVTILDRDLNRLRQLDDIFHGTVKTLVSNPYNVEKAAAEADLVVGAVLIPGTSTPKMLTAPMVKKMKQGAVIIDVAIDQGGCVETAKPTSHTDPSYLVDGVLHYCVTNMPAAVPNTSTLALTNATLPYVLRLADQGIKALDDAGLRAGLNTCRGKLTYAGVAASQGKKLTPAEEALK